MIPHRSFLTVFLLSVVTCGIYWYYYMYRLTQDINQMTGDDGYYTDAAAVVLLSIITCGLGNLVAHYLLIKNFNNIADAYNAHFYFS